MDVATWNVNSLRVRLDHFRAWTADAQPDVICLQETKVVDEDFPRTAVADAGYPHQAIWGQKTYNGVAIVSKRPLDEVQTGFVVAEPDEQARIVRARVAFDDGTKLLVIGCYVPNGNRVNSPKFRYKLDWLGRLRTELDALDPTDQVLVCGDFNIAPADADTWDPFEADGEILFHPREHAALRKLTSWGLSDALRLHDKGSRVFTWWDFRGNGYQRNQGFRIDHHWLSKPVAARCTGLTTHQDVRGWERPSDHVPVVAHLAETASDAA